MNEKPIYQIVPCALKILMFGGHYFLRLYEVKTNEKIMIEELHGAATSKEGEFLAIGWTADCLLKAHCFQSAIFAPDNVVEGEALYTGEEDAIEIWNRAKALIPRINDLNLPYPPFGIGRGSPIINSNSIFTTFIDEMNLPMPADFPGILVAPGKGNKVPLEKSSVEISFQKGGGFR